PVSRATSRGTARAGGTGWMGFLSRLATRTASRSRRAASWTSRRWPGAWSRPAATARRSSTGPSWSRPSRRPTGEPCRPVRLRYASPVLGLWIVLGVVVLAVLWAVFAFNRLVTYRNRAEEGWSQIDVQLRRRYDLIPNLEQTVKGYAAHERELF